MDLQNELIEIQLQVDEMERQGLPMQSAFYAEQLYMALSNSISILMNTTSGPLQQVLQQPIITYKSEHGDKCDGQHFMAVLTAISDRVMHEEEFACLRTRRKKKVVMEEKSEVEKVNTTTWANLVKKFPFDAQDMRGVNIMKLHPQLKIKEAELRERKLAKRRQQRRARHDYTVGVVNAKQ